MIAFITVKGKSLRCPNKNLKLLPYVLNQVSSYLDIIVITDDIRLKQIAERYNVEVFIEDQQIQKSEFHSIYNYLTITGNKIDEFVYIPVTQPFRSDQLIMSVSYTDLQNYDFATTYSIVANRGIFILNEDFSFKTDSYERKGSLCKEVKMVDGCAYKIKTSFLNEMMQSDNVNNYFWNRSKIKFIQNHDNMFLDVDTPEDLKKFIQFAKF